MENPVHHEIVIVQTKPLALAMALVKTDAEDLTDQIEKSFNAVYRAVNDGKIREAGQNVIVYRQLGSGDVDVECGVQVPGPFTSMGEVVYRELPAARAATATHHGPYQQLGETHAALVAWTRTHGLRLTGLRWEIYGDWNEDPQQLRVTIFHQVIEDDVTR